MPSCDSSAWSLNAARTPFGVGRDEHLAAIEHGVSPGRALLRLAAARRVGRRIAAVEPFDFDGRRKIAHHGEQPVPDRALRQSVDGGVGRLRVRR